MNWHWQLLFLAYAEPILMDNAQSIVAALQLQSHPEGGYYKEIYRSPETIPLSAVASPYAAERSVVTSIYFLLQNEDTSPYHRLLSDELWFYHAGNPVDVYFLIEGKGLSSVRLGPLPLPQQILIPKNTWFAAQPLDGTADFCLVSCVVAPGFQFDDFELAEQDYLLSAFPAHSEHIIAYT